MAQSTADSGSYTPGASCNVLLLTKLAVPTTRSGAVSRPRLVAQLNRGLERKLTLVSAPPGFGKTTLVSEWLRQSQLPVAWLSLDAADNEPMRFWTYVFAALDRLEPGLAADSLAMLRSSPPLPLEAMLTPLLNALAALERRCALVLDDYQLIGAPAIHAALGFLLDQLPPQLHLVLITRSDPPLPLPRLRVRGQLAELRDADLRFTTAEAADLLQQMPQVQLSTREVMLLAELTEGWAAALQLAGLSLQACKDTAAFIAAFSGSQRYIFDYLLEEVLQNQSPQLQRFLLDTSVLDRLTASLCEAVTGQSDSAALLEQLERANLFIVPLDEERRWYRYHHLFADVLRERLHRLHRERITELHHRAAAWYEQHGMLPDAIEHAFAVEAQEDAARLIEQAAGPMLAGGEWITLLQWLQRLFHDVVRARPQLALYYAWAAVLSGELDLVEERLYDVEQALNDLPTPDDARYSPLSAWRGQVAAIRGNLATRLGDVQRAIEYSQQALALLPEHDQIIRGVIALNLGSIYLTVGRVQEARAALEEARTASMAGGNIDTGLSAGNILAHVQEEQGDLEAAAASYRAVIQSRAGQPQFAVTAHLRLGQVLYEQNDLRSALEHIEQAVELARRVRMPEYLTLTQLARVRVQRALGESSEDVAALWDEQHLDATPMLLHIYLAAHAVRLLLAQDGLPAAERWAKLYMRGVDDTSNDPIGRLFMHEYADLTLVHGSGELDGDRVHS